MKKLVQKINSDKEFTSTAYRYLKHQLDKETAKPIKSRDLSKIDDLSHDICELIDGKRTTSDDVSKEVERLYDRFAEYEKSKNKPSVCLFRKTLPVLCTSVVLLVTNCITVLAWDMNVISAVIECTKDGFFVDFGKNQEEIHLPTSENDPYGIIAECAKYDIYSETPHYLPNGFYLEYVGSNVNENFANNIDFTFKNGDMSIALSFERYWNEVGKIGIPSDHYNISETTVNGKPAIVSKEGNQYTITFINNKTSFFMFTQDVPYDECDKIVNSIR